MLTTTITKIEVIRLIDGVHAFLRYEMAGKSMQPEIWYRNRLIRLADHLNRPLSELQDWQLMDYFADLSRSRLSPFTIHGHIRAAKRFFRWLYVRQILLVDLGAVLKLPKLPRTTRKGISEKNLDAILIAARASVRDYALLMFIESTGVRRGGVANLLLSDLNIDDDDPRIRRRAQLREKGEKERTVILSAKALESLEAWLRIRPEIEDQHVFLGKPVKPGIPTSATCLYPESQW